MSQKGTAPTKWMEEEIKIALEGLNKCVHALVWLVCVSVGVHALVGMVSVCFCWRTCIGMVSVCFCWRTACIGWYG